MPDSNPSLEGWATNEEMVDFFALQFFKIHEAYKGALEGLHDLDELEGGSK